MTPIEIYVMFALLPNICSTATTVFILAVGAGGLQGLLRMIGFPDEDAAKNFDRPVRIALVTAIVAGTIGTLAPSREQVVIMYAGSYLTNIEGVEDLPPNAVAALNKALDEYAKDGQ